MARAISKNKLNRIPKMWVHIAAIIAVTAWGISFVNTKVLLDNQFSPVEVYVFR